MKTLTLIFLIISSSYHNVGKSEEGMLRARLDQSGKDYMMFVNTTNLIPTDSIVIHTTNSWKISLEKKPCLNPGEDNFRINPIQRSILREEEVVEYEVFQSGDRRIYRSINNDFLKARLRN